MDELEQLLEEELEELELDEEDEELEDEEEEELDELQLLERRRLWWCFFFLWCFLGFLHFFSRLHSPGSSQRLMHKATFLIPLQATVMEPGPSHLRLGAVKTKCPR